MLANWADVHSRQGGLMVSLHTRLTEEFFDQSSWKTRSQESHNFVNNFFFS